MEVAIFMTLMPFFIFKQKSANMGVKNTIKVTYGMDTNWGALILDE
jgi:hypothetical protein